MSSLTTARTSIAIASVFAIVSFAGVAGVASVASGCKKKVTQAQCNELLDHYAELVVRAQFPDAGPAMIAAERAHEHEEAKRSDEFKNCPTEVQESERACAMAAQKSEDVIKCLE